MSRPSRGCSLLGGWPSSSPRRTCRVHCSLRSRGSALCMMALEDVGGSMLKTRLPHSRHRKASVDLADAVRCAYALRLEGRSHLTPTGISPPLSRNVWTLFPYAAACLADQMKSVPSRHMRCRMTANFRASSTLAFLKPTRFRRGAPWVSVTAGGVSGFSFRDRQRGGS